MPGLRGSAVERRPMSQEIRFQFQVRAHTRDYLLIQSDKNQNQKQHNTGENCLLNSVIKISITKLDTALARNIPDKNV